LDGGELLTRGESETLRGFQTIRGKIEQQDAIRGSLAGGLAVFAPERQATIAASDAAKQGEADVAKVQQQIKEAADANKQALADQVVESLLPALQAVTEANVDAIRQAGVRMRDATYRQKFEIKNAASG
jgi:hypothetical protein